MTPTQQWIMDLALVYSVPSFFCGIGITLLFVRWRDICGSMAMMLSPKMVFARHQAASLAPADESLLPDGLR